MVTVMKHLILALLLACLASSANAASRFWVGGTGTWDGSSTTHWSATSGGASGASVPAAGDSVTFNGSSGGGTVTVNTTINIGDLTCGAFTGTLDFSVNNNNVTLTTTNAGLNCSGTGVRTLRLGNGTWTLTGTFISGILWEMTTTTNLTFSANSSTIVMAANTTNSRSFNGGGLTYNNIVLGPNATNGFINISANNTFNTLTLSAPSAIYLTSAGTTTVTSLVSTGTSSNQNLITSSTVAAISTISAASGAQALSWTGVRGITFTGGATFTATNSFNLGLNTGISFPGGGGCILGGWLLWRDFDPAKLNDNFPAFLEKAS